MRIMQWDDETLDWVYEKTDGYCRYCEKKLSRLNYASSGDRGAWEVDHSVPLAFGGTDYLSNLWPACIECNRNKGTMTGPQYKRLFRAPRRSPSPGPGVLDVLAGAFLLYLFLRGLSRPKPE